MTEKQATRNNLPRVPEPGVIGREQELPEIIKALLDPDIPIVTLVGPAGIGKTSLASAVAHHLTSLTLPLAHMAAFDLYGSMLGLFDEAIQLRYLLKK